MDGKVYYQISGIRKSFGEKQVLKGVSFTLEKGGIYCLMGPSGAGKTTLLSILAGLCRPERGTLSGFEGKRFGMVFQENRLLEWENAVENVALVCDNRAGQNGIRKLLAELISPEDLEKPAGSCSGGMKRRIALCRAVAAPSDFLLLDEPFSGLDQETKGRVAEFLLRHRDGRTVLAVTHQPEEAVLLGARILKL